MEDVEEDTPSIPLQDSPTTVVNEMLIDNTTTTTDKDPTQLLSEPNTLEDKNLSVSVPKSLNTGSTLVRCKNRKNRDSVSDTDVKDCDVPGDDVAAVENSVVIESQSVVEDSKDADDVAVVECGGSDMVGTERSNVGESGDLDDEVNVGEVSVDQKDEKEAVEEEEEEVTGLVLKDCEVDEVPGVDINTEGDIDIETEGEELKDEFKGDVGVDVQLEDVEIVKEVVDSDVVDAQLEDVENVKEVVGSDAVDAQLEDVKEVVGSDVLEIVKEVAGSDVVDAQMQDGDNVQENDGGDVRVDQMQDCDNVQENDGGDVRVDQMQDVDSVQENDGADVRVDQMQDVDSVHENDGADFQGESIDNVQENETILEEQSVAEVVKEEEMVADKEEAIDGVKKDVKKEVVLANEETVTGVSENVDEKDTVVEVEEKSLDSETESEKLLVTEKSLDTEKRNEKSLDDDVGTEISVDTEMEAEKSLDADLGTEKLMVTEKSVDTEMEAEKSLDADLGTEKLMDTEKSVDTEMETEKSVDTEMETEKSVDTEMETEKSVDTEMENEEEANLADEEKVDEVDVETELSTKGGSGKRKRGKISKATPRKTLTEDVCFICFDGGDLVLCDRRNCPKAYHPSCVNRDEAFFQSKGSWNCGWHLCSICEKKADYLCYTCTYSLCKACTKTSIFSSVREKEKKGLCEACMPTVMLIERNEDKGNVNFEDPNSWEHLFKDYWIETKAKHNLLLAELEQAKSPWKGSGKQESLAAQSDIKDDNGSDSNNPPENLKTRKSKRNAKRQKSNTGSAAGSMGPEWASKELLELVTHMRNGDASVISQFEVQDLLLEYIKRNKLRDPNRKSQIICDARLQNLFGKPRVAHIEMLKLLESHFLTKEDSQTDEVQGAVVDTEVSPVDDKDKKRKGRKKNDRRGPQSNREDYAAIDIHNINLIYLRRKLVEDLLDDMERFHGMILGTFVRIRVSSANQKQDIYRLVQVTGTSEAAWYTLSKRTTCTMLEILNLDKTETISIDSISNQDFMEDECKRLRQSIKCGLISRLTVGDVLDKAMELQAVRVSDWFETEINRLNHLRDRASDMGRKKELRECVEKLNVLKTPEERTRRLEEFPLIHDDPAMDPEHESEDDTDPDDKKQDLYKRSDSFRFNRRGNDQFSPRGGGTPRALSGKGHEFNESWSGTPRGSSGKNHEFTESWSGTPRSSSAKTHEFTESWSGTPQSSSSKHYEFTKKSSPSVQRDPFVQHPIIIEKPSAASPSVATESASKINESEKMWLYKDPSEKIQGPFSMVQLRRWSKNGYFPVGLKIWRKSDKEDDNILLTDALEGKFTVVDPRAARQDAQSLTQGVQISGVNPAPDSRREPTALHSPTPNRGTVGWTAGQTGQLTDSTSPAPNKLAGSVGVSILQSHDSSTNPVAVAPQNVGQGVQNPVQSSQMGQLVAPPDSNIMQPQMVQSQGWPQNMQPNMSMNMTGLQPLVYNQWPGMPNMVQNPVGNFMPATQEPWTQQYPFPVNQPNMPQPNQALQPNVNWGAMAANPNMGWVAPNTGAPMNWNPMVQGPQLTGTVDPNWMMQAGWVPQPSVQVQGVVPNQGWVAAPVQGPVVTGNGNPSWVGPVSVPPGTNQVAPGAGWVAPNVNQVPTNMNTGWVSGPVNQAPPVANQGWVPPSGNQGPPVQNQGWAQPSGNQGAPSPGNTNQNMGSRNRGGNWGGNDNRGNFSGQRNNRGFGYHGNRSFSNRQDSFNRDGRSNDRDGRWTDTWRDREGRSNDRDDRSNDKDDGPSHKDDGSFQGDGARSSDQ